VTGSAAEIGALSGAGYTGDKLELQMNFSENVKTNFGPPALALLSLRRFVPA